MNKKQLVSKVMLKMSEIDKEQKDLFMSELKDIYKKHLADTKTDSLGKEITQFVKIFSKDLVLTQNDKLVLLLECKKNKFFNFDLHPHKNLEPAWRGILKMWDLSEYQLEGGI